MRTPPKKTGKSRRRQEIRWRRFLREQRDQQRRHLDTPMFPFTKKEWSTMPSRVFGLLKRTHP